jgi:hypothetical protein
VARLVEETYPEPSGHPATARWEAYLRREIAADEAELLEEHLVRCRDCFDLVQAIDAFDEQAGPEDGDRESRAGAEVAAAALSRLVLQQVREASLAPSEPLPFPRAPHPRRTRSSGAPLALAAGLALAVLGLYARSLRQEVVRLSAPQANAQIVYLTSGERAAASPALESIARPAPLTLVLHPAKELPAYRLRVLEAAGGAERLVLHDLQPDEDVALTGYLPQGLPTGRYRLELRPEGEPSGPPLEEWLLRIEGGPNGS